MPITGPASFLPTADEFISHWTAANTALGAAGPIVLAGETTVAGLTTLRATLETQRAGVEVARNDVEYARALLESGKSNLLARLNQFNGKLRSLAPDSPLVGMLPKAFTLSEAMGRVVPPLDDLADLWARFNAGTETALILMGGYTLATYTTDLAALKTAYSSHAAAQNGLNLARGQRNETQAKLYEIFKQYRLRIPTEFPQGSAILETLPRLTPLPGHTPAPVELSGNYDAPTEKAVLAWSAPADAAVTTLQLRASAGPEYDAEDETHLASFPAAGPSSWTGTFGLGVPGSAAAFKIFTLTAEGHECGSNPVTITRPA